MRRIIFLVSAVVSILCLPFLALPSLAWEFELAGRSTGPTSGTARVETKGFGPYNVDNGGGTLAAEI